MGTLIADILLFVFLMSTWYLLALWGKRRGYTKSTNPLKFFDSIFETRWERFTLICWVVGLIIGIIAEPIAHAHHLAGADNLFWVSEALYLPMVIGAFYRVFFSLRKLRKEIKKLEIQIIVMETLMEVTAKVEEGNHGERVAGPQPKSKPAGPGQDVRAKA